MNTLDNNQEIYAIESSVSMQPHQYYVGMKFNNEDFIHEIRLESLSFFETGGPYNKIFYVAYAENGKRLIQMLAETTTVHFK